MIRRILFLLLATMGLSYEGHAACSKMITDDLRPETIHRIVSKAAIATYHTINENCGYPTPTNLLATNSEYWSIEGDRAPALTLKPSVDVTRPGVLSEAVEDLLLQKPVIECLIIMDPIIRTS